MVLFLAKSSVMVFLVAVAACLLVLLGFVVASIWGVAGTIDTWPVWLLTVCRVVLTVLVADFIPFGLSVMYLQDYYKE